MRVKNILAGTLLGLFILLPFHAQATQTNKAVPLKPITLAVDATESIRNIFHARMDIPTSPGPLTLLYPKWIPGEHGPTGPISDLTGLKMTAAGQSIFWQRDPADNYAFHLTVPDSASTVDVTLDFLLPTDPQGFSFAASSSANLVAIRWNTLL